MNRRKASSGLAVMASILFFATAAFHHTGFGYVSSLGTEAGGDLAIIVPILWLFFSLNLIILGLAAAIVALNPASQHRPLLVCLALVPAAAAILQIVYWRFEVSTGVLLVDAAVTLAAGLVIPTANDEPAA